MSLDKTLQELKDFDINDLDFENIGSWPTPVKAILLILVFVACLGLGYWYDISDLQIKQQSVVAKEQELKDKFERMAFKAANLDAYRKQMAQMEESFGALVSQLPTDTEVPGLLEDITNKGLENGLEIESIQLQAERSLEYYVELPISINVTGSYHDMAAFVSGIAGLPRIVTLHDFSIKEQRDGSLAMKIIAKTYRYKNIGGA